LLMILWNKAPKGSQNSPDRLMELELHRNEVKYKYRDLGTESIEMNLATLCRYLVLDSQR